MLTAIIVAAGSSTRAGFDKLFAQLAGKPVLEYSLQAFESASVVDQVVIVARPAAMESIRALAAQFPKAGTIVPGGERRQDSVAAGLAALPSACDYVAVHDAARPLISPDEIERVFFAAREHGAAVLAAPVTDTLKVADAQQRVAGSIDRESVFAMQTPQIFRRRLLERAYEGVDKDLLTVTDEVSAVETLGEKIVIVPAREQNLKITFASDLALGEFILAQRQRR